MTQIDQTLPLEPGVAGMPAWTAGPAALQERLSLPPLLIQYWQVLVRWRLVVAGIMLAALSIGVVVTLLTSPLYTARSQIEINREQKNVTNVDGLDSNSTSPYDMEFYDTQYALLRAESLGERVARALKLADDPSFFAAHGINLAETGQSADAAGALPAVELKRRERQAAAILLSNINIAPIRSSRLVDIKYTSRSPEWSARIANAWPQAFIAANMDRQYSSTADARRFLEGRLATLRAKLEQSERDVVTFATNRNIVTLTTTRDASGRSLESQTLAANNLAALNAALLAARNDRITAQSRAGNQRGDVSQEALGSATIASLRTRREEAAGEYQRMLVQFEPAYPAARALKQQIDSLDAAIARETSRFSAGRQVSYGEAVRREAALTQQVSALKERLDQQQRDTIQYNIYQREADTNRQLYDALLQRYKEIGIAGTVGATNIVIVDSAKVPTGPSAPSLVKNLALALLAGLVIAGAVVLGLEQIDHGIRDPSDVERLINLPLIGNIPLTSGKPEDQLADRKSALSEAYFSVQTALALATPHGLPRTLFVTSAQPGEGKSTTALSLAYSMGRIGKKVLLIDGDMRSPSIHKLVGNDNSHGLSNLLAGDDNDAAYTIPLAAKGVSVLPAGPNPPSAAELLSTDRMDHLLAKLLQRYDHIVIDAPPVLGLADAPLLGRATEGCIFVIETERVAVRVIRGALHRLQVGKNHVFGAVVTKVDYSGHSYGYGYGYGYGYDYGRDKAEGVATGKV